MCIGHDIWILCKWKIYHVFFFQYIVCLFIGVVQPQEDYSESYAYRPKPPCSIIDILFQCGKKTFNTYTSLTVVAHFSSLAAITNHSSEMKQTSHLN